MKKKKKNEQHEKKERHSNIILLQHYTKSQRRLCDSKIFPRTFCIPVVGT